MTLATVITADNISLNAKLPSGEWGAPHRFRLRNPALTDEQLALHDAIKTKATELEVLFEQVKAGRYRALGFTALEESVMWTIKELTA